MSGGWIANAIIGICIIAGQSVCFGFQIVNLLVNRSTEGVSFIAFTIGNLNTYCNALSLCVIQYETLILHPEKHPFSELFQTWITVVMFISLWLMYFIIIQLYFIYYIREVLQQQKRQKRLQEADLEKRTRVMELLTPRTPVAKEHSPLISIQNKPSEAEKLDDDDASSPKPKAEEEPKTKKERVHSKFNITYTILLYNFNMLCLFFPFLFTITYLPYFHIDLNKYLSYDLWSKFLGTLAAVLCGLVWIPQLAVTCWKRSPGNFSCPFIALMAFGSIITIIFLLIAHQKIQNIVTYFVGFGEQSILCVQLMIFGFMESIPQTVDRQIRLQTWVEVNLLRPFVGVKVKEEKEQKEEEEKEENERTPIVLIRRDSDSDSD